MLGGRATPQNMGGIVLKQNKVLGQVNINLKLLMANTPPPPPPPPPPPKKKMCKLNIILKNILKSA